MQHLDVVTSEKKHSMLYKCNQKCLVIKPGLKMVDWKQWSFEGSKAIVWEQTFLSALGCAACS